MRYAKKTDIGFEYEDVAAGIGSFSDINIAIDSGYLPKIAYAADDLAKFAWSNGSSWSSEIIPDTMFVEDLVVNSEGIPIIAYRGTVGAATGPVVAERTTPGQWNASLVMDEFTSSYMSLIQSQDGTLHLLNQITNELLYSNNGTGSWATVSLPLGGGGPGGPGRSLVVDDEDFVHVIGYESQIPGQPSGLKEGTVYMNNIHGEWRWAILQNVAANSTPLSLHILPDGDLIGVFSESSAIVTAIFNQDIVP